MTDISYYLDLPYTKVLKRDDEGDIVATILELDGCIAHGSDEMEALGNLREAQSAWLEHAIAAGQDVPVPELSEELPSGKFLVRVPRSLHLRLNKMAKKEDVSLNQLVLVAATEYVARRDSRDQIRAAFTHEHAWVRESLGPWDKQGQAIARGDQGALFLNKVRQRPKFDAEEFDAAKHAHQSARRR